MSPIILNDTSHSLKNHSIDFQSHCPQIVYLSSNRSLNLSFNNQGRSVLETRCASQVTEVPREFGDRLITTVRLCAQAGNQSQRGRVILEGT